MSHYAVVDTAGNVVNAITWDGVAPWQPPDGMTAVLDPNGAASTGWTYANGVFVAPPAPPPQPPPIPQSISSMQAKVALSRAALLTNVQTWVNAQDAETQLIWNTATTFSRNSALIGKAATALGLTSEQVDQLFITAAAINP